MKDYKNPALSRIDKVLTGHCIACGKYIGNEYDTNFYALIRRKYCPECAQIFDTVSKEKGRMTYRQKTKRTMKSMSACIDQYAIQTRLLKEQIAELKRQLDDVKRGNMI